MIDERKKALRRQIKQLKESQRPDEYFRDSAEIMESVEVLPYFIKANTVMIYWSMKGEVHTHDFIRKWAGTKKIILPSVEGDKMNLKLFDGSGGMVPGELYHIPEPDGPLFHDYDSIDLVVVPGIAFDLKNNRMGRGKAYYDRFLQNIKAIKAGVCFRFQLFDDIPATENDVKMDMVITSNIRMK